MPITKGKLSPENEEKIKKNYSYLLDNIDAQYIIDSFVDAGIFEIEEVTEIHSKATTSEKNRLFLGKLLSSGPGSYQVFINALQNKGYTAQATKVCETVVQATSSKPAGVYDGSLTDEEKEHVMEERDLMSFAKSFARNKEIVATALGLSPVDLQHIQMSDPHGGSVSHNLSLLIKWKHKESYRATLGRLLDAFQEVYELDQNCLDPDDIRSGVQKIKDKYKT